MFCADHLMCLWKHFLQISFQTFVLVRQNHQSVMTTTNQTPANIAHKNHFQLLTSSVGGFARAEESEWFPATNTTNTINRPVHRFCMSHINTNHFMNLIGLGSKMPALPRRNKAVQQTFDSVLSQFKSPPIRRCHLSAAIQTPSPHLHHQNHVSVLDK